MGCLTEMNGFNEVTEKMPKRQMRRYSCLDNKHEMVLS